MSYIGCHPIFSPPNTLIHTKAKLSYSEGHFNRHSLKQGGTLSYGIACCFIEASRTFLYHKGLTKFTFSGLVLVQDQLHHALHQGHRDPAEEVVVGVPLLLPSPHGHLLLLLLLEGVMVLQNAVRHLAPEGGQGPG